MKHVQDIENKNNLRIEVINDLKDLGVKVPAKLKRLKYLREDSNVDVSPSNQVFATTLAQVPSIIVDEFGAIPKFLLDATEIIECHLDTEGLYRRSGNFNRQKELKILIDGGGELDSSTHPFDVIGLIKLFFRDLPDPLLTSQLHDTFVRCLSVESNQVRHMTALLTCLLLPASHLSTLRYLMKHLQCVANQSDTNKMDIANLAVCLAPNLLYGGTRSEKVATTEQGKLLQQQTAVVQLLMERASFIGVVGESLYDRVMKYPASVAGITFNSSDVDDFDRSEVDNDNNESEMRRKKKKRRSSSLQGLVSNLSNSFTKWRRGDASSNGLSHPSRTNTSAYSTAADQSTFYADDIENRSIPVLSRAKKYAIDDTDMEKFRKRKADDEHSSAAFSANKKKAILQGNSTLGSTPFKINTARSNMAQEKTMDSPLMPEDCNTTFNATNGKMQTSPNTSKYINDISKTSNGLSTSTTSTKAQKRGKIKGFLRRLSGSKETNQSALGDSPVYTQEGVPASVDQSAYSAMDVSPTSAPSDGSKPILPDMTPQQRRRRERTHTAGGSLRRGRPNTLTVGLPSNVQGKLRRSIGKSSPPVSLTSLISTTASSSTGQSSGATSSAEGFGSPVKREYSECTGAFDTSPIQKVSGAPCGLHPMDFEDIHTKEAVDHITHEAEDIYEKAIKDMKDMKQAQAAKKCYMNTDLDAFCDPGMDSAAVPPPLPQRSHRNPSSTATGNNSGGGGSTGTAGNNTTGGGVGGVLLAPPPPPQSAAPAPPPPTPTCQLEESAKTPCVSNDHVWPHTQLNQSAKRIPMEPISRTKKEHDRHFSALRFPQSPLRCLATPHRAPSSCGGGGVGGGGAGTPYNTARRRAHPHRRGTSPMRVPKSFQASLAAAAALESMHEAGLDMPAARRHHPQHHQNQNHHQHQQPPPLPPPQSQHTITHNMQRHHGEQAESVVRRAAKIPISTQLVSPCAQILRKQNQKNTMSQVKRLQPSPSSPAKRAKSLRQFKSPLKTTSMSSNNQN